MENTNIQALSDEAKITYDFVSGESLVGVDLRLKDGIGVHDVDVLKGEYAKDLVVHRAKASSHLTRLLNAESNGSDNIAFTDALFSFNRKVFNRFEDKTSSNMDSTFLRTKASITSAHIVKSNESQITSVEDIPLDSSIIIHALSSDVVRNKVFNNLSNMDVVNKIVTWLLSNGRDAQKGTKRYTMQRLYRKVGSLFNETGDYASNETILLGGRLLHAVLEQFDWRFTTLTADKVIEPNVRLMSSMDIKRLYIEGWIAKHTPSTNNWVTKYNGDDRITPASVEEVITSSFINLKRQFMQVNLLSNRADDVIALAKVRAAITMGLIPVIGNETIAAILDSSADIEDMSKWYAIVSDMLSSNTVTNLNAASQGLKTNIGDINLFLKYATEVATCVREHKLVESVNIGDLLSHISVKHNVLPEGGKYHTVVKGSLSGVANEYYHYIEEQVGSSLFSHIRIRENDNLTLATSTVVGQLVDIAADYIADRNDITAYTNLSKIVTPDKMWGQAPHYISLINVTGEEIRMLALLFSDILVEYSKSTEFGDVVYIVRSVRYIVKDVDQYLVSPYPLLAGDVYTSCPLVALLNINKESKGHSLFLNNNLAEIKSQYLVHAIKDIGNNYLTSVVPEVIFSDFVIKDSGGNHQDIRCKTVTSNYIVTNPSGNLTGYTTDNLLMQASLVIYALQLASSKARFANGPDAGYDDERNNTKYLVAIFDKLDTINVSKHVAYDLRYDVARQLSSKVSTWTNAYHNLQVGALTRLAGINMPLRYLLSPTNESEYDFSWFTKAFNSNKLFRDILFDKVK